MANPEDQPAQQQPAEPVAATEAVVKSEFLDKVSEIPAVNTAKEYGTAVYNQVKGLNRFTAAALTVAESTALYLAVTAKPFLEKVQPQAKAIDHLACEGLVAIEQKAPFIMKPTEELIGDARKLVSSTVERASETLDGVKNYGMQKINDALVETENLVDRYIPPAFGEGSVEASSTSSSVPERARELTNKIGLRLYGHSIKQVMPIHNLGEESASKLSYVLALLVQLKEGVKGKSMQEMMDYAKVQSMWIWDELNKEPADAQEADKSLEQRALSLARRTTSVLVHAYAQLPINSLPTTYQEGMQTASRYATELFTQMDQATNASEITVSWLQSLRQKALSLEELIQSLKVQEIEMEWDSSADFHFFGILHEFFLRNQFFPQIVNLEKDNATSESMPVET